jgi:hypothetical protein
MIMLSQHTSFSFIMSLRDLNSPGVTAQEEMDAILAALVIRSLTSD